MTVVVTPDVLGSITNIAAVAGPGLIGSYFDYDDTSTFSRIPSFVDGSFLRNDAEAGQATVIQLADLPEHESLDMEFVLAIIDSWDGDHVTDGPDELFVEVDGTVVFQESLANVDGPSQSFVPTPDATLRSGARDLRPARCR